MAGIALNTYEGLDQFLYRKGSPNTPLARKKLQNNTIAMRYYGSPDGVLAVVLHSTSVVLWKSPTHVALNTGGWITVTTKDRINRYAPDGVRIASRRGKWILQWFDPERYGLDAPGEMPFFDLIELTRDPKTGLWSPLIEGFTEKELALDREDAHNVSMRRMIDAALAPIKPGWNTYSCPLCAHLPAIDKPLVTQHYLEHIALGQITQEMVIAGLARAGYTYIHTAWLTSDWGCARIRRLTRSILQDHLLVGAVATKRGRRPV